MTQTWLSQETHPGEKLENRTSNIARLLSWPVARIYNLTLSITSIVGLITYLGDTSWFWVSISSQSTKMARAIFWEICCRPTFENNAWNCIKFGSQGDLEANFDFPYFDHGLTSRDLSVTLAAFFCVLLWIAQLPFDLKRRNLGKKILSLCMRRAPPTYGTSRWVWFTESQSFLFPAHHSWFAAVSRFETPGIFTHLRIPESGWVGGRGE